MISSLTNAHVKRLRLVAADRRERRRERLFVLEGVRLIADALHSGAELVVTLFAPEQLVATAAGNALLDQFVGLPHTYEATPDVVAAAAETVHPQGVVALARWPEIAPVHAGVVLVLDALQDPGNAGTLLRSAEACGVAQVLCARGSVDLYSPKVVRAAMGAHFRLPLRQDLAWHEIGALCTTADQIYAADMHGAMPYYAADWRQSCALIIGNEAQGLSDDAAAYATCQITIPMRGGAESLNAGVAGSVILFEALRQRSLGRS